jgi:NhaP-type Na+/H+ or K+/H+ antiporter
VTGAILTLLWLAALGSTIFALVHAVRQRADAFTAVDKLTKPIWVGILAVALVVLLMSSVIGFLGLAAVVATGVYLADVRPKVDEVQRGPRW